MTHIPNTCVECEEPSGPDLLCDKCRPLYQDEAGEAATEPCRGEGKDGLVWKICYLHLILKFGLEDK